MADPTDSTLAEAGGAAPPRGGFQVLSKPSGPLCNLDCRYCFYTEKDALYPKVDSWRMSPEVLERYVKDYFAAHNGPLIEFAWQGGEPTLMGVEFFREVLRLQKKHCPEGKKVNNALQTNGVLLDEEWCALLAEHDFLVGLSIDGPRELHDGYRVDRGGKGSFDKVIKGLELLRAHGVKFNFLCVVHRKNAKHPAKVYRFLKEIGAEFIQFIPLVERSGGKDQLLRLAGPPHAAQTELPLAPWSVRADDYGKFLIGVFDEWVRNDVGKVFVQLFDIQVGTQLGHTSALCVYAPTCGGGLLLEHNGDVYACDHYVYPEYLLGNLMDTSLAQMATSPQQSAFGLDKRESLPEYCRACSYLPKCWGGCPKHRFEKTPDGAAGLNYLCSGLRAFFSHSAPQFEAMAELLRRGQPAARIMDILRQREALPDDSTKKTSRNAPCPCGSGRKFKRCHGK